MTVHEKTRTDVATPEASSHPLHEQEAERQLVGPVAIDTAIPRAWDGLLAYVISKLGSPPMLATAAMALIASTLSSPRAWRWAGVYVFLAIVTPVVHLIWLVRQGQVTDVDVQLREQRTRPLIFAIACAGLAWLVLALGGAPMQMVVVAGGLCLQMAVIFGITLRWKISVHSAAAAGVATLAWSLVGTSLPLLIGVPIIAWSRVRLHRHTVAQTVAGAALGLAIFLVAVSMTC
jgi:membrane-associated phospholipid phosphatase